MALRSPTRLLPGTTDKIALLTERARFRLPLFVEGDATLPEGAVVVEDERTGERFVVFEQESVFAVRRRRLRYSTRWGYG
jgi:hypothetical protein